MNIRLKRHYPLIILFLIIFLVPLFFLRGKRIISYTTVTKEKSGDWIYNLENPVDLFDESLIHNISITIPPDTLKTMIKTYQETGRKDYFHADIIIDGVKIPNAGIRLKGNATLMKFGGLKNMIERMKEKMNGKKMEMPKMDELPEDFNPELLKIFPGLNSIQVAKIKNALDKGEKPDPSWFIPSPSGNMKRLLNEYMPMLISFDEFEEGRRYQGYRKLAIRTSGVLQDPSFMSEPLSNYAVNLAGIKAPNTSLSHVRLNNNEAKMYSLSEVLDDVYVEKYFPGENGILYKVLTGGTIGYKGDDPSLYYNAIEIKAKKYKADMAPLIRFMKFLTQSSDEEFANEIENWVHMDSILCYLAVHNLIGNYDSIAGIGNNIYLHYSPENEHFRLLTWDTNESFGKISQLAGFDIANLGIFYETKKDNAFENTEEDPFTSMLKENHVLSTRLFKVPEYKERYIKEVKRLYNLFFKNNALLNQAKERDKFLKDNSPSYPDNAAEPYFKFLKNRKQYLKKILF